VLLICINHYLLESAKGLLLDVVLSCSLVFSLGCRAEVLSDHVCRTVVDLQLGAASSV
jgi:hypothetical protein